MYQGIQSISNIFNRQVFQYAVCSLQSSAFSHPERDLRLGFCTLSPALPAEVFFFLRNEMKEETKAGALSHVAGEVLALAFRQLIMLTSGP